MTHQQVLDRTAAWVDYHGLHDRVIVVVDHGATASAFYLKKRRMAVVFAGEDVRPAIKADDVIANGVSLFVGKTLVVTADNELQARCRRASSLGLKLHIMDPQRFLDDLEWVTTTDNSVATIGGYVAGTTDVEVNALSPPTQSPLSLNDEIKLGRLDAEIKLRGQLLEAELQLDKRGKAMTNKRRKKIQSRIQALRKKLALRGPSLLDRLTSLHTENDDDDDEPNPNHTIDDDEMGDMSREQQDILLSRWRELQYRPMRKERTGDRVIYAERLRRELEQDENAIMLHPEDDSSPWDSLPSALAFVQHINSVGPIFSKQRRPISSSPAHTIIQATQQQPEEDIDPPELSTQQRLEYDNSKSLDTINIVAISDTHGFEGQLDHPMPEGDILLHLGDFALEGSHDTEHRGLKAFDTWLAKQPHPYKIVVRGNHDPWSFDFPKSKAMFVTTPTSINLGGFEIALVPHGSARKMAASGGFPPTCDVMASHLPPFKTLDRTYTGKFAGSNYLTSCVRGMVKPPRLWLAGHIHEGRGLTKKQFGKHQHLETTVVNCANANSGRATHLAHGPVVLKLDKEEAVEITRMDDKTINQIPSREQFFHRPTEQGHSSLLLAVDLGLKSGLSLYNEQGSLVRYEQFTFNREMLQRDIVQIMVKWEADTNNEANFDFATGKPWKITHVAVEGGDTSLLATWTRAIPNISLLRVSPEEWRSELLNAKESQSGESAKAASRLIARQIVEDFGSMDLHAGKFPTDVAESVLLGMYCCRRLGWITRTPVVRRFTNGNVVTPKKTVAR